MDDDSLFDQVLPKENGVRYPWNFMFQKCFWKKRSTTDTSCTLEKLNDHHAKEKANIVKKDVPKPTMETISLEMKQQELDNR